MGKVRGPENDECRADDSTGDTLDGMDDDRDTFLLDNDPAKLLPFEERLIPEDPEPAILGRHFMRGTCAEANE